MHLDFQNYKNNLKSSNLFTQIAKLFSFRPSKKQGTILAFGLVLLFALVNVGMAMYYQTHFYPNTKIGAVNVGGMSFDQVADVLAGHIEHQRIQLAFDQNVKTFSPTELGANYNIDASIASARELKKPVIPLLTYTPWGGQRHTSFSLQLDEAMFNAKIEEILENADTQPVDAQFEIKDGQAKIIEDKPGRQYNTQSVKDQVKTALTELSAAPVVVQAKLVPVQIAATDLQPALGQTQQKLALKIRLTYAGQEFQPTSTEIGQWLNINQELQVAINQEEISAYIEGIATEVDQPVVNQIVTTMDGVETDRQSGKSGLRLNRQDVLDRLTTAIGSNSNLDYQLKVETIEPSVEYIRKYSAAAVTYNYCVVARGVDASLLSHFSQKAISTLADSRGWNLDGRIQFHQVQSGCTFNLVLADANVVGSYAGCSIYWSCRVGTEVLINVNNWLGGTTSWNNAGGSIDNYQNMVINHEVGHWLGFGHATCGGAGQPAPIMQQQSISLSGCVFNPWPTPAELSQLRAMKGL